MKKHILLLPVVFLATLISCSKEDPMEKEKREITERIADVKLDAYKAFKVSLRGTAAAGKDSAFDRARLSVLAAVGYAMMGGDSALMRDPVAMIKTTKEVGSSITLLAKTDEDSLPTVLENIDYVLSGATHSSKPFVSNLLNENEEHLMLGGIWISTPGTPSELPLYEFSRTNDDALGSVDMKLIAKAGRSLLYLRESFPYHAEKSADELIALTEKEKDYLLKNPWPMVDANGNAANPEQAWHQLHGIAYLLRGLSREKMDGKEEDALDDLETFIKESEAGGLDNEATWSAGAYVAIKKENKDDAIKYLDKLAASKALTKDELEAVKETRDYIESRENGKALNSFSDKLAILKIGGGYFYHVIRESKPVKNMNNTAAGKEFMRMTHTPFKGALAVPDINTDSLVKESKSLIDKVF